MRTIRGRCVTGSCQAFGSARRRPSDVLIAAHARSLRATLVIHNTGEFGWVQGLLLEDWEL